MTDWTGWRPQESAVLLFLQDQEQVLLIHKKRGLGQGKVNAPGGRVEAGETWEQAARRETWEETGLRPEHLTLAGMLQFQFTTGYALEGRVFLARGWSGVLTACDEADPFWQPINQLPWNEMWADDALWLPEILKNRFVRGRFLFDADSMKEAEIEAHDRPPDPMIG